MLRDVSHFERIEKLGEGPMERCGARPTEKTQEKVAIKKLRNDCPSEGFSVNAIREIKLLKSLSHENIVRLKDVVPGKANDKNSVHLVFEFMDYDLDKFHCEHNAKFNVAQTNNIVRQILCGLANCHKHEVIIRDMKGANILINEKGEIKIADFGLARKLGEPDAKYSNNVVTL